MRPDTYVEANLYPAHRGAAGAYNRLICDRDGRLGSGTAGHALLDAGDPALGFKSYDWWGNVRSYQHDWSDEHGEQSFSAVGWDRWALRDLYVTGGDGGLFWDGADQVEPFSVLVGGCDSCGVHGGSAGGSGRDREAALGSISSGVGHSSAVPDRGCASNR